MTDTGRACCQALTYICVLVLAEVIDRAVAEGAIDIGVHSLKDTPVKLPEGVQLAACLPRDDPRSAHCQPRQRSTAWHRAAHHIAAEMVHSDSTTPQAASLCQRLTQAIPALFGRCQHVWHILLCQCSVVQLQHHHDTLTLPAVLAEHAHGVIQV